MKQLTFCAFAFGLLFSAFGSANAVLKRKCDGNVSLIMTLRDSGVIQNRKYLSVGEILTATAKKAQLSAKRKALKVDEDMLKKRIATILEQQTKKNDAICIANSAALIRNLSDYADFATNSKVGLEKFVKDWRAKAALAGPEAEGPELPSDLPPALK